MNLPGLYRQLFFCPKRFFRLGRGCSRPVKLSYTLCDLNATDGQSKDVPSMIVIHGLFGSKRNFDSLAKAFSKRAGLKVISVDARNHGESDHSPDMTYQSMAGDVLELVSELGLSRPTLLGHSMGGKIAMTMALLHPEEIGGLIVADMVPARSVTADTDFFPRMIARMKEIQFDLKGDLDAVEARREASQQLADTVQDPRVRDFLLTNLVQREGKISWRINLEAIGSNYDSLMSFPDFGGRTFPGRTLFIGGSRSDMITDKHLPVIKGFFPDSKVVHVEGSGHWVHADNPQAFAELVLRFVGGPLLA